MSRIYLPYDLVKSIDDAVDALEHPDRNLGRLETVMPDGSEAKTVEEVAALNGSDNWAAAIGVLQCKSPLTPELVADAKDLYAALARADTSVGVGTRIRRERLAERPQALSLARRRRRRKRKKDEKALYPPEHSEYSNSICLMIAIDPVDAERVAMLGGTPPEEIHVTLGWYGEITESLEDKHGEWLAKTIELAKRHEPFDIALNGITRFSTPNDLGRDPIVLNADSPVIETLRRETIDTFGKTASEHGFTPHMTVGYTSAADKMPLPRFTPTTVRAIGLHLSWADRDHVEPFRQFATETVTTTGRKD